MPSVAFETLGCKVNFYDTEAIWQVFKNAGYEQVPFEGEADVYVINTCTVTGTGDKKSRQAVRRAVRRNADAVVVATGCYAQVAPQELAAIAGVDLVVGNDRKSHIVELVEKVRNEQHPYLDVGNILKTRDFEEMDVPSFEDRSRANLKIQDGCNNFCTFCIIPYARGLIRSRKPESVLAQARKLVRAGFREIVLTGIHTGGYGADLDGYRLSHLVRDLETIDELYRFRISSIEASEIDDSLIEELGRSSKVCKHLHIPIQAGHDAVLKRMNRHYTVSDFAAKLKTLRQALPDVAITSDVIVGFPGETDEYFDATEAFIREQAFAMLHVFPYSKRKGTPAARFVDQVDEAVKHRRTERLLALSSLLADTYARQFLNKEVEVIPDHNAAAVVGERAGQAETFLEGITDNYLRVRFKVPDAVRAETLVGEVCRVKLTKTASDVHEGAFVSQVTAADADGLDELWLRDKRRA